MKTLETNEHFAEMTRGILAKLLISHLIVALVIMEVQPLDFSTIFFIHF